MHFKPSGQQIAVNELHQKKVGAYAHERWSHAYGVGFSEHFCFMLQSKPVGVNSSNFQSRPLPIQMGDYDYAYEAFAQNRHVESACFPRKFHGFDGMGLQFCEAILQFGFACFWIAYDRGVGFFPEIFGEHHAMVFQCFFPSF
jgi:hypothetical protein